MAANNAFTIRIQITFQCCLSKSQAENNANADAVILRVLISGHKTVIDPNFKKLIFSKNTCTVNQVERFKITPTTAAVIPHNAPSSRGLLPIQSI